MQFLKFKITKNWFLSVNITQDVVQREADFTFVEDDVEDHHNKNSGVETNKSVNGVEFSLISHHHEAEENQHFGESFHEDLSDEEDDVKGREGLIFVLIPWGKIFNTLTLEMFSLPDVVVGIRNWEKWEQDGHRAPINNLSQVADKY